MTAILTVFEQSELDEKLRFLRDPSSYPHGPATVEVIESHMSWVFLAGQYVFKMKKPVRYEYLDFTTREKREYNCREEARLNARLAPGIYCGVVALRRRETGRLTLEEGGEVLEWLVKMKRLPANRMLDWLIEHKTIQHMEVDLLAERLVRFYKSSDPVTQSAFQVWNRFAAEHELDAAVLCNRRFDIDHDRTSHALARMRSALGQVQYCIQVRVEHESYVEGHGDLRPEHVCLLQEPVIIDCLEFSRDLRIVDPFDEIAFLALECERLGAGWIGQRLLERFNKELINAAPSGLVEFYRAARALLRARLTLAHLLEPNPRTPAKWEPRARQYIALAEAALQRFDAFMTNPVRNVLSP